MMRAEKNAVNPGSMGPNQLSQPLMYRLQPFGGHHPPTNGRLIGDQKHHGA
jgi:hypothetical protein